MDKENITEEFKENLADETQVIERIVKTENLFVIISKLLRKRVNTFGVKGLSVCNPIVRRMAF